MNTIREELGECLAEYQAKADSKSSSELRPLTERSKALQEELRLAISNGASPCCKCGNHPIGLRHVRLSSGMWSHIYEIGCCEVKAKSATPQEEKGTDLTRYDEQARVASVAKWNSLQVAKGE